MKQPDELTTIDESLRLALLPIGEKLINLYFDGEKKIADRTPENIMVLCVAVRKEAARLLEEQLAVETLIQYVAREVAIKTLECVAIAKIERLFERKM